jgi:hypothetical protein
VDLGECLEVMRWSAGAHIGGRCRRIDVMGAEVGDVMWFGSGRGGEGGGSTPLASAGDHAGEGDDDGDGVSIDEERCG